MIAPYLVIITIAAVTYRVTRLIIADRITEGMRGKVQAFFEGRWSKKHDYEDPDEWRSSVAYALSCAWCTSIWVATAVCLVIWAVTPGLYPVWFLIACVPTASAVTGLLYTWETRQEG